MINKSLINDILSLSFETDCERIIDKDAAKQLSMLLQDEKQENIRYINSSSTDFHESAVKKLLHDNYSKLISTISFLGKEYFCRGLKGTNIKFVVFYDPTDRLIVMINNKLLKNII